MLKGEERKETRIDGGPNHTFSGVFRGWPKIGERKVRTLCAIRLFEDVAVSHLEGLAIDGDRGVPGPDVLDVLAVSLGSVVELGELVTLPVGADGEGRGRLLAADKVDTLDDTGVVGAVDTLATKEVLAGSLKTGLETTDQVVGHEGELQLVVVLVVNLPEGVLLRLEVLPEPGHGNLAGVIVGVLALPLVKDEGRLAKGLEGVLGLGGLRGGLVLGSGSGSGSLGLLLLLGGSVLDALLSELRLGEDSLERVLVDDGVVPAGESDVLLAVLLVKDGSESTGHESSSEEISEGDALANQVGVLGEVVLENSKGVVGSLDSLIDNLLVVALEAQEGAVPASKAGENLAVGERHPADDGSVVLLGLAKEGGLLVLGGHCKTKTRQSRPLQKDPQ